MNSIVDHIAILVDDLEHAEEWYTTHLSGSVAFRDEKYIRVKLKNSSLALIDKNHYPWPHVGILVDNKEDLPHTLGETIEHRDGTIGVYVKDPFGNYLEYIWHNKELQEIFCDD